MLHLLSMNTGDKEQQAKQEATRKPGRDDVHEQREPDQGQEGKVEQTGVPHQKEDGTV
ncbi:MAG: hypothetical protein JWP97_6656 [Labilithrix sp.]|nr:hypothetical protein [Labilithrix sp.]